jgi:sulfite reductase (NADPH) flavoprotein alpha-component
MLTTPKLTQIQELIAGSSREELVWLSGYLAGVVASQGQSSPIQAVQTAVATAVETATPATPAINKITIAYGTETGNSKKLAGDFAAKAKKKGINAKLVGLEQYRLGDLTKEEYFFAVISTQGDGEPPAAAKKFYDHIHQGSLKLERLKYGVLALGDTSYPLFCKAGEDVDHQLHKAGGQRIVTLEKCDTDYESQAGKWFETVLQQLSTPAASPSAAPAPAVAARPTGKKIYTGTVLANINLNDRGSAKKTHHLEIAAEAVDYQPGDALGLIPENPAAIVDAILAVTGVDPNRKLTIRQEEATIGHLLRKKLNIVYLPERVVKKYAAIVQQDIPETRIGLLDLLKIYPVRDAAQFHEVVSILEPTAPRLYSIASSPEAHSGEIHLTVTRDSFSVNGETKHGLCSDLLSQLSPDQSLDFYIHKNLQFRLPSEEKDVIMIGPGTGIAPFRSFLAHRDSQGASGRNWLFFGDQHFTTDFLYQTDLQNWVDTGVLTRLNTAFSRDQNEKVYVQHRMRREAAELYRWLEEGAYVYVCGAKEPMSVDVEGTLLDIIRQEGKKTPTQAEAWLDELKEAGRYVKDVY